MPGSDQYHAERSMTRAQRKAETPPVRRRRSAPNAEPVGPVPDLFVLSVVALAIGKSVLARGLSLGWSVALPGVWLDAGISLLLVGSAALIFRRRSHLLVLAIYLVYSILLFADSIYAGFFQQMLDPQMFKIAGQTAEVSDVIVDLLRPIYLLFFIDIPLLLAWAVLLRRRHAIYQRPGLAVATGVALLLVLAQIVFAGTSAAGTDSATIASAWGITSMQLSSLGQMALPRQKSAFAAVAKGTPAVKESASAEFNRQLGEFNPNVGGQRIAPLPVGAAKGKNVIIVQFESLQEMFIGATIEGQSVTPNMNKFVADSWNFENAYSQTGIGNTADSEFTIATSMLPPLQQNATTAYADRVLPGMPRMANAAGYETITLHTNAAHFWFRDDLYKSLNYDKYYDQSYFNDRDKMWRGSSDEVLYEDGLKAVQKHLKTGNPVYAAFVTMTSHVGYNYPLGQDRRPLKLSSKLANTYVGKYAGSISYADYAFGKFIKSLKASGLYDKSVIIVVGDHMGYKQEDPTADDVALMHQIIGRDYSYVDHQRTALAIHIPGQKPKVVTSMRAVDDIMPTVADLLGFDLSETPHFGRSMFVEAPRLIPMRAYFPGGSYIDNNMVFVAGATEAEDQAFYFHTNKQITPPARSQSQLATLRRFNALSDDWMMSQPVREGGVNRRLDAAPAEE